MVDVKRINELAKKHKTEGLTEEEAAEWKRLHAEYIASVKASLQAQLNNTYVVDEKGNKTRLTRKDQQ